MLRRILITHQVEYPLQVGDVIEKDNKTYVIINIMDVEPFMRQKKRFVNYTCLCQKYHSPNLASEYIETESELAYTLNEWHTVSHVGDFIYDTETKIYVEVTKILSTRFEGETMYVNYEFTPVPEWSESQMREAVFKYRRRFMHLVSAPQAFGQKNAHN
ncbi:hypothetical protein SAMN05216431_10378 [Ligilactobacillus sp. WC1T17]|uniref:Uncharacterized protein n=1 Tax=Ligilactobacillus ruminis TaxID=1623 RepID=A0ABY1AA69_9LACO|nr:hypothetical protein SAMN05216431_10378 [Ligilactobacillus ruminis]